MFRSSIYFVFDVSSIDSELCDVSLKSVENRLRLLKTLECALVFPPPASDSVANI